MEWSASRGKAVLLDFLERAGWSAGQVFFATLLAGGAAAASAGNLPWKYSSTLAASAAASSVVLTAVQYLSRMTNLPFWPDLIVRLAKTFLASLAASFTAGRVFDMTRFHWTSALNVAVLATLTAIAKGLLARGEAAVTRGPGEAGGAGTAGAPPLRASPSTLPAGTYARAVGRQPPAGHTE